MPKIFIFDFDSTIFPGETLDEIIQRSFENQANAEAKKIEIATICNRGMTGQISMKQSLLQRLEIAAPTPQNIAEYVQENQHRIEPAMRATLAQLQAKGHQLFVVSGGFEEWIKPLLDNVVPPQNIFANQILNAKMPMVFDNILQRDKETIVKHILKTKDSAMADIIMIGDGATDFSVFEKGMANYFMGAFYYTQPHSRDALISKIEGANQPLFFSLQSFFTYLDDLLQ